MMRNLCYIVAALVFISCGTSKSVKDLLASQEYGIKKVHIEKRNSSYDQLTADYLQNQKPENVRQAEELAKDTLLYMSKGPCLGHCPVYSIVIYNNGKVLYDGLNFVDLEGIYESNLDNDQLSKVNELVSSVEVTKMASRYPPTVDMVADVARTKVVVARDGIKYDTTISYGEPESLKHVQEYLEKLSKDLSWVQI